MPRRDNGLGIANRLRSHPVLAIRAVQIAAQHSEAVGERSAMRMEERLLLNWITLHTAHVAPGDVQNTAAVEAHFAYACLPLGDGATVPAGITTHAVSLGQLLVQFGRRFAYVLIKDFFQASHGRRLTPGTN